MSSTIYGFELISLGHLIKREHDRFMEDAKKKILGDDSIACGDLSILKYLSDNSENETYQKNIENYLSLTAPSVSAKLKKLQSAGLIERVYSLKDTRLKQVKLTDYGREVDEKLSLEMMGFEKRITYLLSDSEKDVLKGIISNLKREFE